MFLATAAQTSCRIPSRLISRYPTGFAWPADDDRFGRYVMCPVKADAPFGLGVVDDFGNLVTVPSTGFMTAQPTTGLLA